MSEVTRLLGALGQGESRTTEELLPLVYEELRRLAAHYLAQEQPGQTLQATALVHEAYLRLVGSDEPRWEGRRHFFGAAAEAMRRILVEHSRRKHCLKHGGGLERVDLQEVQLPEALPSEQLLALDDALTRLAATDPEAAELVKLRFFAGLTEGQTAELMGLSRRTAARCWAYARAWLYRCALLGHSGLFFSGNLQCRDGIARPQSTRTRRRQTPCPRPDEPDERLMNE